MSESDTGLLPVAYEATVQQGDIFRVISTLNDLSAEDAHPQWCLILTADCDIAQNKLDSCFTVLPIVSAREWLDDVWADEKVDHAIGKTLAEISSRIWTLDKARDPVVQRMSPDDVRALLSEASAAQVGEMFGGDRRFVELIKGHSTILAMLDQAQASKHKLSAWAKWKRYQGASDRTIGSDIRDALSNMRGAYFFLPEIPESKSFGYVVLLREIRAVSIENVFRRSIDVRSTSVEPPYLLRAGRLSDKVRYAISQQVAVLFSRVGLSDAFESACDVARDAVCEDAGVSLDLKNV